MKYSLRTDNFTENYFGTQHEIFGTKIKNFAQYFAEKKFIGKIRFAENAGDF